MSEADARLKALFGEDEPAPRDPVFTASVMAELARRRFRADVAWLAAGASLGALVLWALWPSLSQLMPALTRDLMPAVAAVALAALALRVCDVRLGAVFALNHD
jgi:hypothetical protein